MKAPAYVWMLSALVGAASTVVLAFAGLDESRDMWSPPDALVIASTVTIATLAAVRPVWDGIQAIRGSERARLRVEAQIVAEVTLRRVVKRTGLDWTAVGVNVFLVRVTAAFWRPSWPPIRRAQVRIAKLRIRSLPKPSGIPWTKGKGVIGACWETQSDIVIDLAEEERALGALSADEFEGLPSEDRFGFTHNEFKRTRGTYGAILAVPIKTDEGEYLGCITVDAPGDSFRHLSDPELREDVGDSADVMLIALRVRD